MLVAQVANGEALDAAVVHDFDGDALVFACFEGQRGGALVCLDEFQIDAAAERLGQFLPAVLALAHREEHLLREEAAPVVVGVQQPDGDLVPVA